MKAPFFVFVFSFALTSCCNTAKMKNSTEPVQSLNITRAQLLTIKKCVVLVLASQQEPSKVSKYFVLQGVKANEQVIPKSILNASSDFVSLQAGEKFWILTLSESDRYRNLLTDGADTLILKGFGLAKYQESGLNFDTFIAELKAGKQNSISEYTSA